MAVDKKGPRKKKAGTPPSERAIKAPRKPRPEPDQTGGHQEEASCHPGCVPIVGLGASAGGLAAFEAFFSGKPVDASPNLAIVRVPNLDPDHKSMLAGLIQRYTRLQVFEVEDGMTVKPNCAYIIPPNRDMALVNGTLQLLDPAAPRGQRLPIDFFFRSLAQDLHEHAICIILSGTGSDGTLGVRAIKGEGGMVMVQTPDSTEYDGMPRSALATGMVDFQLPPAEMPGQLISYVSQAFGTLPRMATTSLSENGNALNKIFLLLCAHTGHDFSGYKPSTVNRRIDRRMAIQQIDSADGYVRYLQQSPAEVEALFGDLLIGVTNFFRDPEAFKAIEEGVVGKLFAGKSAGSAIRIWIPGCSTGEEAYSIAILLQEHMERTRQNCTIQIFATDIDGQAIATARLGLYPASIGADISQERLARFFTSESDGSMYRIHKGIRDMLVFSEQDVLKDPPFSRLDMISCRNLLIYMGASLQKKLIPLFHYTLNPGGILFLGTSETVGDGGDLFSIVDRKFKIYQRKEIVKTVNYPALGRHLPPIAADDFSLPRSAGNKTALAGKPSLRELTEATLLKQVVPTAVLVDRRGDILYLHGRTGLFLELGPGEIGISNILKMARDGLRQALTAALNKVAKTKEMARHPGLRVKTNGDFAPVNLTVIPIPTDIAARIETPLFLVILEKAPIGDPAHTDGAARMLLGQESDTPFAGTDPGPFIAAMQQELRAKDEYLQSATEELETSNEELKSTNEEMQSVNEELQSTNEELETSKEELQSVNEELATVNTELQNKVADLSRSNSDMNNLLAGTGIGTVFVDHRLHILRFTPSVTRIINLIQSDIGRPVGHIVSNLVDYDGLVADTRSVLDTLVAKEVEVQTKTGSWYTMRIQPYRTLDNVIEGAVLTFVDISDKMLVQEALRRATLLNQQAAVVQGSRDAMIVVEPDGGILAWNPAAARLYGWSEEEALAMNIRELFPEGVATESAATLKRLGLAGDFTPFSARRITKDGRILEVDIVTTALLDGAGQIYALTILERVKGGQSK